MCRSTRYQNPALGTFSWCRILISTMDGGRLIDESKRILSSSAWWWLWLCNGCVPPKSRCDVCKDGTEEEGRRERHESVLLSSRSYSEAAVLLTSQQLSQLLLTRKEMGKVKGRSAQCKYTSQANMVFLPVPLHSADLPASSLHRSSNSTAGRPSEHHCPITPSATGPSFINSSLPVWLVFNAYPWTVHAYTGGISYLRPSDKCILLEVHYIDFSTSEYL